MGWNEVRIDPVREFDKWPVGMHSDSSDYIIASALKPKGVPVKRMCLNIFDKLEDLIECEKWQHYYDESTRRFVFRWK